MQRDCARVVSPEGQGIDTRPVALQRLASERIRVFQHGVEQGLRSAAEQTIEFEQRRFAFQLLAPDLLQPLPAGLRVGRAERSAPITLQVQGVLFQQLIGQSLQEAVERLRVKGGTGFKGIAHGHGRVKNRRLLGMAGRLAADQSANDCIHQAGWQFAAVVGGLDEAAQQVNAWRQLGECLIETLLHEAVEARLRLKTLGDLGVQCGELVAQTGLCGTVAVVHLLVERVEHAEAR